MRKKRRSTKTHPRGKNAKVIQVNLDKATAQAVAEAATRDNRSVSNWVGMLIEREVLRATDDTAAPYGEELPKIPAAIPHELFVKPLGARKSS